MPLLYVEGLGLIIRQLVTRKGTLPTLQSATVDVQSLDNEDKEELVRVLRQAVTRNDFVFGPTHFVQFHFVPT